MEEVIAEIVKDETPVPAGRAVVIEARLASEPRRAPWLGRKDSNLRMAAPKAAALPLGDSPRNDRWELMLQGRKAPGARTAFPGRVVYRNRGENPTAVAARIGPRHHDSLKSQAKKFAHPSFMRATLMELIPSCPQE